MYQSIPAVPIPGLIGFLYFRPPKIYARKITVTTLENLPKAQNFLNTHSLPARQSATF
jgi:hypothetical protein